MFTRMEVVEPPYIAPHRTPVRVISPTAGPKAKVNGSMSVIVAVGPTPGRIPTMVPMKTPQKQARRYFIEKRVTNPFKRNCR